MKKIITVVILFLLFHNLKSQEIIDVTPDNCIQGETINLTITGQDAHFAQATNTVIWFNQASSTIYSSNSLNIISDNEIQADFSFSIFDPKGDYNVNISNNIDGDIVLEDGFTLNLYSTDTFLVSSEPNEAYQNKTIEFKVSGYNTHFKQATNTVWFQQGTNTINPYYMYVSNDNFIYPRFSFTESDPTGLFDLYVHNTVDDTLVLKNELTLLPSIDPSIKSISPNIGFKGDKIELTITGENTSFSQASNLCALAQDPYNEEKIIFPENIIAINDTKITAEFAFSNSLESGSYDFYFYNEIDYEMFLEDAFMLYDDLTPPKLISVSPDNSSQNESITLTLTGQYTNFNQGSNSVWFSQGSNSISFTQGSSTIYPKTIEIISDTEIQAYFNFNEEYVVGSYTVNVFNLIDGNLFMEDVFTLDYASFISKFNEDKIIVFPNPSNGNFRIDNISEVNCTISIISIEGKILKTYTNESDTFINISVSGLKGYYLVRINNSSFQSTRKILIH